jgi:hypothetical protein
MNDAAALVLIAICATFVVLCLVFRDREVEGGVGPAWFKAGRPARKARTRRRKPKTK